MSADEGKSVVGVAIGTSALNENSTDPALQRAMQEELLEDLSVHGRLVFASNVELETFLAAVQHLPTSLAKAWEALLASRRVTVSMREPAETPALDQLLDALVVEERAAPDVELVLVEAAQAALLGVARGEFSTKSPNGAVEIGRISTATRSLALLAARRVTDAPLREGESRELEWSRRLEPFVTATRDMVIYDKYVGLQTARRYLYEQDPGDGLTWLLTRLGSTKGYRVRIITATMNPDRRGREFDETALSKAFTLLYERVDRPISLDLVFVPDRRKDGRGRVVDKFGHDRHIRFGPRAALGYGLGIQSFAQANSPETISVAQLPVSDAKHREERAAQGATRPPKGGWIRTRR